MPASFSKFAPLVFVCIWATGFVGARMSMPWSEPGTFLTIRFAVAFALLALLAALLRGQWPGKRVAVHCVIAGMFIHGLYLGGVFWAVKNGMPAAVTAVLMGLQPLLTAILAGWLLGERITSYHWAGLVIGLVGVGLVLSPGLDLSAPGINSTTVAVCLVAVLSMTTGTIYQKNFVPVTNLGTATTLQYLGALIPVGILCFGFETRAVQWTGEMWLAMVWSILVLSLGAIYLLMWLIRNGSVAQVAALFYLVPAVAAVMTYFLFGDTLVPAQLLGMGLCAIGVALATRKPKEPQAKM